jgi:hypothetical protein
MRSELKELIGRKFFYKGKNITIQDVKFVGLNSVIRTNVQSYNLLDSEIERFLSEIKEINIKETKMEVEKPKQDFLSDPNSNFSITRTLIETIQRVKDDKEYIGQANAICNITSQLINIKKLELMQLKK